jgi:hypothetical protein
MECFTRNENTIYPKKCSVLRISPNLKPCKKFRKADIFKFVEHLKEGKCAECIEFFRMLSSTGDCPVSSCEMALAVEYEVV